MIDSDRCRHAGEGCCPDGILYVPQRGKQMVQELTGLEQLLDRIGKTADNRNRIFLSTILETVGSRSFGPLLLMAGVILASPLSGIPGMPTTMGVLVLLIAVQLLFDRKHFWLPR